MLVLVLTHYFFVLYILILNISLYLDCYNVAKVNEKNKYMFKISETSKIQFIVFGRFRGFYSFPSKRIFVSVNYRFLREFEKER